MTFLFLLEIRNWILGILYLCRPEEIIFRADTKPDDDGVHDEPCGDGKGETPHYLEKRFMDATHILTCRRIIHIKPSVPSKHNSGERHGKNKKREVHEIFNKYDKVVELAVLRSRRARLITAWHESAVSASTEILYITRRNGFVEGVSRFSKTREGYAADLCEHLLHPRKRKKCD